MDFVTSRQMELDVLKELLRDGVITFPQFLEGMAAVQSRVAARSSGVVYSDPVSPAYSQCKASSVSWNDPIGQCHGTGNLDSPQGWSANLAKGYDPVQWWQMDTGSVQAIGSVTTQGRAENEKYVQLVTAYTVKYSTDERNWQDVDGGKTFTANKASDTPNTKVTNVFSQPVMARYLRIVVTSCFEHITMRAGYSTAHPFIRSTSN